MYAIPTAFVSALFVVFGLYVLITQGVTRLSAPFLLMCTATFAWQGTWTLLFQTEDPHIASVLVRVGYLFILFLPTTFYHFVTEVAARRRERPVLLASYGMCLVLAVLLPGNEVVAGYRHFFFGYYPSAGPLHPLHVLQTVLLAGRSGQLLLTARKQAGSEARRRLDLCFASLCVYSFAAVDYAVNYGYAFYPPGVLFIALSLGLLAITIVRYHLIHPYAIAATIAHEIATPLATIAMHADEIASVWSHVFKGYRLAVTHGLYDDQEVHSGQAERISQARHGNQAGGFGHQRDGRNGARVVHPGPSGSHPLQPAFHAAMCGVGAGALPVPRRRARTRHRGADRRRAVLFGFGHAGGFCPVQSAEKRVTRYSRERRGRDRHQRGSGARLLRTAIPRHGARHCARRPAAYLRCLLLDQAARQRCGNGACILPPRGGASGRHDRMHVDARFAHHLHGALAGAGFAGGPCLE